MASLPSGEEPGDLSSTVAFSLLFLVPAVAATAFWAGLKVVHNTFGVDQVPVLPGLLVTLSPVIISVAVAQWACRRSGTSRSTARGFSIAAAGITVLFAVVAAAWFINAGD